MKKLLTVLLAMASYASTACSSGSGIGSSPEHPENPGENDNDNTGNMNGAKSRYLVIYSSRTGNTASMANIIRSELDCDMMEVLPHTPYDNDYNQMLERARAEQAAIETGNYPAIGTMVENFDDYDVIFIGYPIWYGRMSTTMQSFLHHHAGKLSGKRIALFASSGSSGIRTSVNDARSLIPEATFTQALHLTSATLPQMDIRIASWLEQLNLHNEDDNVDMSVNNIKLTVGSSLFTATLVDNSSTRALKELLAEGDISIDMRDYARMEKVGSLGTSLPANDEYFTASPGDLILYQGNSFVIYYAPNSYTFTRLGKIDDVTRDELIAVLGSGNVTVTLSL